MDIAAKEKLRNIIHIVLLDNLVPQLYEPGSVRMDTPSNEHKAERGRAPHIAQLSTASDIEVATGDKIQELEHVAAKLPARVWLAATIGMAERFAYYGTQTLFRKWQKLLQF